MHMPVNRAILCLGMVLVGVGAIASLASADWVLAETGMGLIAIGAGLYVLGLTLLCAAVRCRRCGFRLFWRAISTKVPGGGLRWFFTANTCSACGFQESRN